MTADNIPIVLGRCRSYEHQQIKGFCDEAAAHLGLPTHFHGSTILLKPNLISSLAPQLACSDGRFVRAVAEWFVDKGARLRIGDSPSFGSAAQVLVKKGIAAELVGLDVEIIEFLTPKEYQLTHGVTVGVSEEALACDLLVNLPRVKAHNQMYVTLAVKNMFGIVCGMRKAMCHMKNGLSHKKFADLMLDLGSLVPNHVTLIDGIESMSKRGPINGEMLHLGLLGAGRDPVALDTLLLSALELDHRQCPVWRAADAREFPGARRQSIDCFGEQLEAFRGLNFQVPSILNPVPFNPFRFLKNSLRRFAASAQS